MTIEELRRNAAERIRVTHRRHSDGAAPTAVTISPRTAEMDLVVIVYENGETREFERLAPVTRESA
jgi:hypothetical protein